MVIAGSGSILALVQSLLLLSQKNTICFNEGCKVVDSMTRVSPLVFNLSGFLFFQAVFWLLYFGYKRENTFFPALIGLLLLSGIAAEGVLFGYQNFVAKIFCSYCLIIFSLIVLLNFLQGFKQIIAAAAVFAAVQIGFASLQFSKPGFQQETVFEQGVITTLDAADQSTRLFLFFSSSCPHCEAVIKNLKKSPFHPISFNPVDQVQKIALPSKYQEKSYDPALNISFLANFGISEVPVLMVQENGGFVIIRGKEQIIKTIKEKCYNEEIGIGQSSSAGFGLEQILPPREDDQKCRINSDCEGSE